MMILKVEPDKRQLLNYLSNIIKSMIITLRLKPGENLKTFVVKMDNLLMIMCYEKCKVKVRRFKMI